MDVLFYIQKSAQYLQRELPIRLAHRVSAFRGLPFIVAINQHFCAVVSIFHLYF